MTEKLERILVIDDSGSRIRNSLDLFGEKARNIQVVRSKDIDSTKKRVERIASAYILDHDVQVSIEAGDEDLIARALSEESYKIILLDGNLNLGLEGEYFDGNVVARKLREGAYGTINQNTEILTTSSDSKAIPQAKRRFRLDFMSGIRQTDKDRAQKLFKD